MASLDLVPYTREEVPEHRLPSGPDLDILIVGKTGHGKSATANSILGEKCFASNGDTTSVTTSIQMFQKEIDGRKLLVVDTPGVWDTNITDTEQAEEEVTNLSRAICLCPQGFHVVLLLFRYGNRLTKEEIYAVAEVKKLWGEDFVRECGILIFTYGDEFKRKMSGGKGFKTWCKEQTGFLQTILSECQGRILLFDNEGNQNQLREQRCDLVKMVDMNGGKRYDQGIFKGIKKQWERGGRLAVRDVYVASSKIYFDIKELIARAKVYDQKLVDEIRVTLKELQKYTEKLDKPLKKKMDQQVKECEKELKKLENKIKLSEDGVVQKGPDVQMVASILSITGGLLAVASAPLMVYVGLIAASVVTIGGGAVAVVGGAVAVLTKVKKCVIQ